MRIEELKLAGHAGRHALEWKTAAPGIHAIYGPRSSGKTAIAEFLAHALYGQHALPDSRATAFPADGELLVEGSGGRYRLRRFRDGNSSRLTVAAIDSSPVDHHTVRSLTYGLPPHVLGPLCAVSFHESPPLERLLSEEFVRGFQSIGVTAPSANSTRIAELTARRDVLAQELETRIAGERRASKELDARWQELDRVARQLQEQVAACDQRRQAAEAALAETDARLRYRRLELNPNAAWLADRTTQDVQSLPELDAQIAHWRTLLADVGERLSRLRARLTTIRPHQGLSAVALLDQRAWLSVARQLAADLTGEVSRLARASASQQCVCHDAHPRLRPIADTLQRQIEGLDALIENQRRAVAAAELHAEIDHLGRTEADVRRHLDHLLDRRQAWAGSPSQSTTMNVETSSSYPYAAFGAADIEQLERRRIELEQERFQLHEELREYKCKLRDLRAQRDTVERQRASLLSARSIEHVQRELADVQRKLEQAAASATRGVDQVVAADNPYRASDFLAQLTNGNFVRLELINHGRRARVLDRTGGIRPVELLSATERDQVYLSLCLALHAAAAQHGAWLPLVLDDPFARLDGNGVASLAAVLDGFARQGHQVIVFTGQQVAAERLHSLGIHVHDIANLRHAHPDAAPFAAVDPAPAVEAPIPSAPIATSERSAAPRPKRRTSRPTRSLNGKSKHSDRSDAA